MPVQYATINYYATQANANDEASQLSSGTNTGVLQTVDSHSSWRVAKVENSSSGSETAPSGTLFKWI